MHHLSVGIGICIVVDPSHETRSRWLVQVHKYGRKYKYKYSHMYLKQNALQSLFCYGVAAFSVGPAVESWEVQEASSYVKGSSHIP